jgi:hypothetical protein
MKNIPNVVGFRKRPTLSLLFIYASFPPPPPPTPATHSQNQNGHHPTLSLSHPSLCVGGKGLREGMGMEPYVTTAKKV